MIINGSYIDVIAGPCSAESEQQLLETAEGLEELGISFMRIGVWKPRSRSGSFCGVGEASMPWIERVRLEHGMNVMVEVGLPRHVECILQYGIDAIWIGARTSANPFMMTELADSLKGVNIPVFIKNPICPDVELWKGAVERILNSGIKDVRLIHRGFCLYDNSPYRNVPLWDICDIVKREFGNLPLYCDPSHMAGKRDLIPALCLQALEHGIHGLFIESHCKPENALSDASQQLTPMQLKTMLESFSHGR